MPNNLSLQKLSIFRVGEVFSVDGRTVCVKVDRDKNLSHILFQGSLVKNVTVGSYIKILKGFTKLVAKVESECIKENKDVDMSYHHKTEEITRQLSAKLLGYFENGKYHKGVKELPLIGNACLLMDNHEFSLIHKFSATNEKVIKIGCLLTDENVPIEIGINKLFTSHIGIFGNTGSGKSYTLANLYKQMLDVVSRNQKFKENAKFLLYDFNGEYSAGSVISSSKKAYKCNTHNLDGDKIPLRKEDLLKPELFYILANATEKTQQPFIKRTLALYNNVQTKNNPQSYMRKVLQRLIQQVVCMTDHTKANLLLDYFEQILPPNKNELGEEIGLQPDLEWHGQKSIFYTRKDGTQWYFDSNEGREHIKDLTIYTKAAEFTEEENFIGAIIQYMHVQLIKDVLNNRAMNEHVAPAIKKLQSIATDFAKVFIINDDDIFGDGNFVVIDLNKTNLNMKKLVPLIVSTKLYNNHKDSYDGNKYLNLIIDEAHNILSYESMRESETWKDFRLETFEEIIKEGRKFGVFLTIASQRPSDISATIISQLHTYFIHRLINNKDLDMIANAVSYLDKISMESLPILPVGACVLSGVIADLPVTIQINKLEHEYQPTSDNISLSSTWFND